VPRLSICCFRYRPAGVYCSNAVIDGRFGLRACIVNFRTEAEHVERLLEVAAELGRREQRRRAG
jgi:aromatic-L-amino-acid decarboxylase